MDTIEISDEIKITFTMNQDVITINVKYIDEGDEED
jgi:hypothetical protein